MTIEHLFFCMALLGQAAPTSPAAGTELTWQSDLAAARRQARETDRLVLMHFGGTWCEPCRRLEQQVFSQPAFGRDLVARYVAVKVDPRQHPELAEKYGVRAVPTDVVTTARGQLVMKIESPTNAAAYSETMVRIADSVQPTAGAVAANTVSPQKTAAPPEQNTVDRYADYYQRRQTPTPPAANAATQPPRDSAATVGGEPAKTMAEQNVAANNEKKKSAANTSTAPASVAPKNPPFALDMYCHVTLVEKRRWEPGSTDFGAIHRGRTYLFVSKEAQQAFLANPDRYSPVFAGNDPVLRVEYGKEVPGKREHGAFYNDRIYLFTSEDTFRRFDHDPARYTADAPRQTLRR